MHYLHDVHEMNAYRADNVCVCVSVCVSPTNNLGTTW
jgi:hypothetical protein